MSISLPYAFGLLFFMLAWLSNDHYRPWLNFQSEMLALLGLFGLFASALSRVRGHVVVPRISAFVSMVILVPWIQYAAGVSLFAGDAVVSSLYLSALLAAIFVGYSLCQTRADHLAPGLMGLMHCFWIAALVSAGIGLAQWLNLQDALGNYVVQTDIGTRAMGNLGQPNQLATLLLMGMAAFAYVYQQRVIGRPTFFLGIAFLTGVLVLTQSRSGMLSVLVVSAFLAWKKGETELRLSRKTVLFWAIGFIGATILLPYLSELLLLGEMREVTSTGSVNERLQIWKQIAYAVTQSPWIGYGWNQTSTAHAAGAIAFPGAITYTYAHNLVLDLLAWSGLPLGLLIVCAIAYWFVTRIKTCKRVDAVYAMAGLLPLAVHSMLEFPFAYAYFLIAAGFMIGIVEAAKEPARTIALNVRWAWGFLLLWVTVGSYLTYEYFLIEEDFRIVRFEGLRVGKTPQAYEIPSIRMASHMAAMLKAARQVAEPNMEKADLENLRKSAERFSYGAIRFRYALALALNGDTAGASHQLVIIRGMYGEVYYAACKAEIHRLEQEKYPQLVAVHAP